MPGDASDQFSELLRGPPYVPVVSQGHITCISIERRKDREDNKRIG